MAEDIKTVYLTGDTLLVKEFGEICLGAGIGVRYHTARSHVEAMPRGMKTTSSIPKKTDLGIELSNLRPETKKNNIIALDRALPPSVPILTTSVTVRVAQQATWLKHPSRLVGFSGFPSLISGGGLVEIAAAVSSERARMDEVSRFFTTLGREISVVEDQVGMVMPRILCTIVNEAFFALTENVASPQDIDTAMKLGVNYPRGPVEWADSIGIPQIVAVLDALGLETGEERYRVAPLLRQMSFSPPWWKK